MNIFFKFSDSATNDPRYLLWRRNSMRKTQPITLPDQNTSTSLAAFQNPLTSQSDDEAPTSQQLNSILPLDYQNVSDTHPLVLSMESTDISPEVPLTVDQLLLSDVDSTALSPTANANAIQRSRTLGDDFLDALTSSTDSQNITTNLNSHSLDQQDLPIDLFSSNNLSGVESNETSQNIRQTGRRGEGRTRIVSITTETNSLGNQRIIVNHDRRPSSAPTISCPISRAQQQPTYVPSESSSVITSRNTSPVSLASSSASSTTTSCTNER